MHDGCAMKQRRDVYQRKIYAVARMNKAMIRLEQALTKAEKESAAAWVAAWIAISGIRQYKLDRKDCR
jgi:hypothetical protein